MAENSHMMRLFPFNAGENQMETADRWDEWIEELDLNFRVAGITDPMKKKDVLLLYGGKEIRKLDKSLADSETSTSESDEYLRLKAKLTEYFSPKKNIFYNRFIFLNMRPLPGEITASYVARLREKISGCEFYNDDERILEHLMMTSDNEELIRKVIYKKYDLKRTLEAMQLLEDASTQIKAMNKRGDIARIKKNDDYYRGQKHPRYEKCRYCNTRHQKEMELCPAWGETCFKCEKQNHFAVVCLSDKSPRNSDRRKPRDAREVRGAGCDTPSDDSESDSEYEHFMKHVKVRNVKKRSIFNVDGKMKRRCNYCGKAGTHKRKEDCVAYGRRCWNCNKLDHLKKVCRARYEFSKRKEEERGTRNDSDCRSIVSESELSNDNEYIGERITDRDKLLELFSRN